ncbi:hypothetical protein ACS0TY_008249 [Phlomoides rotata]
MPQYFNLTILLEKIIIIISSLKCALKFLLYQSFFFQSCCNMGVLTELDPHSMRYSHHDSDAASEECVVCLCGIEENEEIRELKPCGHIFHRACFDRWVGYGHWTCPLCRNNLRLPTLAAAADDGGRLLVFNFCQVSIRDNDAWWLR